MYYVIIIACSSGCAVFFFSINPLQHLNVGILTTGEYSMYFRAWGSLPLRQLPFRPALQSISPARCLSTSQMFRQLVLPPRGPLPVRLLSNSAHPFDKVVRLARIEEAKKKAEAEFQSCAFLVDSAALSSSRLVRPQMLPYLLLLGLSCTL